MLTNKDVNNAKPDESPYQLSDGRGMYLVISPTGSKYWRFKYRFLNRERRMALGVYPDVSLADAREKREAARKLVAAGVDPAIAKKDQKRRAILNNANTFEAVAREWHANRSERWQPKHAKTTMRRLEANLFPYLGSRPIADIDAPEVLEVLRRVEKRGAFHSAGNLKQFCGQIFRYGIATGRCHRDHAADLKGALKVGKTTHFAALDIKEMPEFLKALENNDARLYDRTRRATRLLMLTLLRTSELIEARWSEIDLENAVWVVPAPRMKMRKEHIVPLSKQALAILEAQKEETGHFNTEWVFPSLHRPQKHMSNNTILFAIGRMGYKKKMTGHGFRALAMSTIKEKLGYRHEVVDRQLAHAPGNKVDRAYDRAKFLDDREKMMQEWADYLDVVAKSSNVLVGKFQKKVS